MLSSYRIKINQFAIEFLLVLLDSATVLSEQNYINFSNTQISLPFELSNCFKSL